MQNPSHNRFALKNVDKSATFESFDIYDPEQSNVVDLLVDLADQIIASAQQIKSEEFPFECGKVLFVHSHPGYGKTHLINAFINRITQHEPDLAQEMALSRANFASDFGYVNYPCGDAKIVIIDDMFHDRTQVGCTQIFTDVPAFLRFMSMIQEKRSLAIVTSNFPILGGGMMAVCMGQDKIGQLFSRAAATATRSHEIELKGKDYRMELSVRQKKDVFTL